MKSLILSLTVVFAISACCNETSQQTEGEMEEKTEPTTTFSGLDSLIKNKLVIFGEYLITDATDTLYESLQYHQLLKENPEYIIIRSIGGETANKKHYLISFSKESGKMIAYVSLGNGSGRCGSIQAKLDIGNFIFNDRLFI